MDYKPRNTTRTLMLLGEDDVSDLNEDIPDSEKVTMIFFRSEIYNKPISFILVVRW
jgi:hypothetical protein